MRRNLDELIAALADGTLEPDRVAEAEALVRTDPDAAEMLRAHRQVLRVIAEAAPTLMTVDERARLHGSVADALGIDASVPPAVGARRRVPWPALATTAAALVAVLAVTPLVGMLTTGGVGFDFDRTALRGVEPGEVSEAEALDDTDPVLSFGGDGPQDEDAFAPTETATPGGTVVVEPPPDEGSGDTTTTATSAAAAADDPWDTFERELGEMVDLAENAVGVEETTSCSHEASEYGPDDASEMYVTESGVEGDGTILIFFLYDADGQPTLIAVLDAERCEPVGASD